MLFLHWDERKKKENYRELSFAQKFFVFLYTADDNYSRQDFKMSD